MTRAFAWICGALLVDAVACGGGGSSAPPAQPSLGEQLDRGGRVAISTGLIESFNPDAASKAAGKMRFNRDGAENWSSYVGEAAKNLAILDGLDTVCGNQLLAAQDLTADRYTQLATVLMDDQLYVDTTRGSCGQYLALEAELVGALPAGTGGCGGRTPLDDVIETTYSALAIGALSGLDDTVTTDGAPHSLTQFPFLAPPPI